MHDIVFGKLFFSVCVCVCFSLSFFGKMTISTTECSLVRNAFEWGMLWYNRWTNFIESHTARIGGDDCGGDGGGNDGGGGGDECMRIPRIILNGSGKGKIGIHGITLTRLNQNIVSSIWYLNCCWHFKSHLSSL